PSGSGANFKLNTIMASLEPFKKSVTSFDHLENAASNGSVRAYTSTWLSCASPVGPTLDQIIAGKIGSETMLPSLQVSTETTLQQAAGNGNLGCEVSFSASHACLPTEYRPRKIFTKLFGDGDPIERASIGRQESSLLDFIRDQTRALQNDLGASDRAILDGHLESVRQTEVRVQQDSNRQAEMDQRLGTAMADLRAVDAR